MNTNEIYELDNDELNAVITETFFENKPETKTIRELRAMYPSRDEWCFSECKYHSPKEMWQAEIGTDIDLDAMGRYNSLSQDEPCTWLPSENFSEWIGSTWVILDDLKEKGFNSQVENHENYCTCTIWAQNMNEYGPHPVTVRAKTAPLAICRAALLAVISGSNIASTGHAPSA